MPLFRFPAPILFLSFWFWFFALLVIVIICFVLFKTVHLYISTFQEVKHSKISVQMTVTEHQMVKMTLLLFQNLAALPSTTGRTSLLLGSGQDLATALARITSNFKAKGT